MTGPNDDTPSGRLARDVALRPGRAALLLAVACAIAFSGSLGNGFVLDDHQIILSNPMVTDAARMGEAFFVPYQGDDRNDLLYRPLTTLSLAVQWALHGPAAWVFHLVNVLLHIGATVLVWFLGRALLPGRPLAVLIGALVFAVHPIHTDAVSSIVNRSEVLAAGFAIGAFLAFFQWAVGGRRGRLAIAAACFLGALLSKESGAPLIGFALLWGLVDRRRTRPGTAFLAGWTIAFVLPLALYAALRFAALDGALVASSNRYFQHVGALQTLLTMLGVGARYLKLLVVPFPLAADYSFESIPIATRVLEPWPLAGLVLVPMVLAGTCALLAASRRGPGLAAAGLGMAWFVLFMAPATNIVPLLIPMAERIAYGASAGAFLAFGVGAEALWAWAAGGREPGAGRPRPTLSLAVPAALALLLALLAGLTVDRDRVWRDDLTLAADNVSNHPRNALMLANLASALATRGDLDAGIAAMRRVIEVGPSRWDFRLALAEMLHDAGRHEEEAQVLVEGLRWRRGDPAAVGRACDALVEARPDLHREQCVQGFLHP
jgi:hypothetical protein